MPQEGESRALPAVGRQQALPRQRRAATSVTRADRRAIPDAFRHYDETIAILVTPEGLRPVPREGGRRSSGTRTTPRVDESWARSTTCWPRSSRATSGLVTEGFPQRRLAGRSQRLLAVPRLRGQGAGRRQDPRPRDLPQQRHRPHQPRRVRGLVQRVPHAARASRRRRRATRTPAASATWAPITRRRRSTRSRSTASTSSPTIDKMNLELARSGSSARTTSAAPTCATCHMSATKNQPVTHDIGLRISWNNRPVDVDSPGGLRCEDGAARQGHPVAGASGENMKDVCLNGVPQQELGRQLLRPVRLPDRAVQREVRQARCKELYELAKPLIKPVKFGNKIDFIWFELWHHEGRRARHAASMMGPDYTHWHGTYDLAKNFYSEYIPELEELVEKGNLHSERRRVRGRRRGVWKPSLTKCSRSRRTTAGSSARWTPRRPPAESQGRRGVQEALQVDRYGSILARGTVE